MTGHEQNDQGISLRIQASEYLSFSRKLILALIGTAVAGGLGAAVGASLYTDGYQRTMLAYLVAFAFVLSISLGSLFFVLIQHLTRAGWAVLIRRPAEVFAYNVITVAILFVPVGWSAFRGSESIYPWARVELITKETQNHATYATKRNEAAKLVAVKTDSSHSSNHDQPHSQEIQKELYIHQTMDKLTLSKTDWLNPSFFLIRLLFCFTVWVTIAGFYFRNSRNQDFAGGNAETLRMEKWAGPACFAFALTLTFAAFDLLMSLDPHWYSTIFGVYYFAGCAVGGFSVSLLSWLVLSQLGMMSSKLSNEHFRDLGRLLFAFIFFWGYIAFSQYMLLWYANMPETTRWLAVRGASLADGYRNTWGILLVVLLFGHFIIPFLGIMSRHVKGNRQAMIFWTIWLLVMHYLDLVWLVMPELGPSLRFGLPELSTMLLVCSLYLIGASYIATCTALIPIGDPRLKSSITISDVY